MITSNKEMIYFKLKNLYFFELRQSNVVAVCFQVVFERKSLTTKLRKPEQNLKTLTMITSISFQLSFFKI